MDNIKYSLEKFCQVDNGLSSVDGSFFDIEVLKTTFCAISLTGIRITGPYKYLLINVDTSYDTHLQAFPTHASYIIQADKKGKKWVFPNEAQLVENEAEQILM